MVELMNDAIIVRRWQTICSRLDSFDFWSVCLRRSAVVHAHGSTVRVDTIGQHDPNGPFEPSATSFAILDSLCRVIGRENDFLRPGLKKSIIFVHAQKKGIHHHGAYFFHVVSLRVGR